MTTCRGCNRSNLHLFLPLGLHPLANGFLHQDKLREAEALFPLNAYVCLDCGLIQIKDQVPAGYFRHYVYVPSAAQMMHEHFAELARSLVDQFSRPGGLVVDIGCNDGLLLRHVRTLGARALGIDPAANVVDVARRAGVDVIAEYFTPDLARQVRREYGPATVAVATNTFHHIGDLNVFTEGLTVLLDTAGVIVIEVPHALEIVRLNQFDGIYHEHVSQFTVKSFVDHLRRFDIEIVEVAGLAVHGGSIRVVARRTETSAPLAPSVAAWVAREEEAGLFSRPTYEAFQRRVTENRRALTDLLARLKGQGAKIAGYGASARGNTLLNYCGIGPDLLSYIVDRNSLKHGLYTPGQHIPVRPAEVLLTDRPDYVLILAWNFAPEIMRQQDAYRRAGGQFILPIPEPVLVGNPVGAAE